MRFRGAKFSVIGGLALLIASAPARADEASLYAEAKKEGQVVWYTTLIVNQAVRPIVDAFQKKYPGVEVKFNRADSVPTALKLIQEARAGGPQADIVDGIETYSPLAKAGLIENYPGAHASKYPAELKDANGAWNAMNVYFLTAGYNTNLIKPADAPKNLEGLLDPKLKGRIAWSTARSAGGTTFVGAVLKYLGEEKGMAYLKRLQGQQIVNTDITARAILDQVITGEYLVGVPIFNHHALLSKQKGAPVDWVKLDPIIALIHLVSVVKGAKHPAAGRLLLDFITSEDGQKAIAAADYLPAMPAVPAKEPTLKPEGGSFTPVYLPPAVLDAQADRWERIYKEMFR